MNIKVIGKAHLKGTSKKTGRDYDFIQLHYIGKDNGVIGDAALTLGVDPSVCPFESIEVGATYDVDFGPRGRVVNLTLVTKA